MSGEWVDCVAPSFERLALLREGAVCGAFGVEVEVGSPVDWHAHKVESRRTIKGTYGFLKDIGNSAKPLLKKRVGRRDDGKSASNLVAAQGVAVGICV